MIANLFKLWTVPAQYREAIKFAQEVVAEQHAKRIWIAGHSLGGGQAMKAGSTLCSKTFAFNPAFSNHLANAVTLTSNCGLEHVTIFDGMRDILQSTLPWGFRRPEGPTRYFLPEAEHGIKSVYDEINRGNIVYVRPVQTPLPSPQCYQHHTTPAEPLWDF